MLCTLSEISWSARIWLQVIVLKDEKIQTLERLPSDIAVPAEQSALGSVLRYEERALSFL